MARQLYGDLSLATARVGVRVVCVRMPNMAYWEAIAKALYTAALPFTSPQVGEVYMIRATSSGGILFAEVQNKKLRIRSPNSYSYNFTEPLFPFNSFCLKQP